MKKVFLLMLVCAALHVEVSATTGSDNHSSINPQEAAQKSEDLSPELLEAQKLNAEVVKLFKAGKFDEATPLAKRVLEIREKALAPGHQLIALALANLGELYRARKKYGEAKTYYQRLLTIYEQASAQDHAAMSNALDALALLNYMQLNFDEAEKLYRRALTLREQANGQENLEVARSLYNLAEFYRFTGDYKKAEPLYQRAIEIKGNALGPDDREVKKALEHYSCLYYAMNQPERLEEIRNQFIFLWKKDVAAFDKGEILNGKAISLPKPEYPGTFLGRRLLGRVVIKITIDETGKVIAAADMCGAHPLLADAAARAAYKARFTPTIVKGVPVKVPGIITYNFVMQ